MKREVVEYGGIPVGIVVPDDGMLRFIAVKFHVIELDKRRFNSLAELNIAIRNHLEDGLPAAIAA